MSLLLAGLTLRVEGPWSNFRLWLMPSFSWPVANALVFVVVIVVFGAVAFVIVIVVTVGVTVDGDV